MHTKFEVALPVNPSVSKSKGQYLFIEEVPKDVSCLITMAPLNSSGDIYHILAYLILSQHHNMLLPTVELTYDRPPAECTKDKGAIHSKLTVGNQVDRAIGFANTLFSHATFERREQNYNKSGRENIRHKVLVEGLRQRAKKGRTILYVDQMATTTMIAKHCEKYGYKETAQILRDGFAVRNDKHFPAKAQEAVDKQVKTWLNSIDDGGNDKEDRPLVVLHIRISRKANKEQNLPDNFLQEFTTSLCDLGYQVGVILADDRKKSFTLKDASTIIEPFKGDKFFIDGTDYAKQAHLSLLLELERREIKAVIGNTSGTLDLAAFIGIATYGIHQFFQASITYQESRVFIQMWFMAIDELKKDGSDYFLSKPMKDWLNNPKTKHAPKRWSEKNKVDVVARIKERKGKSGFEKLFSLKFFSEEREISKPTKGCERLLDNCI